MTGSALKRVSDLATNVSAVMINLITVLFLIGIVLRRLPNVSDPGATELATILGIWIVYLAFLTETLSLRHLKVDYFVDQMNDDRRRRVILFGLVLGTVTTAFLFVSSIYLTMSYMQGTTPAMNLPKYVLSIPLVFGFGFGSVAFALKTMEYVGSEA